MLQRVPLRVLGVLLRVIGRGRKVKVKQRKFVGVGVIEGGHPRLFFLNLTSLFKPHLSPQGLPLPSIPTSLSSFLQILKC